jgi:hypothetical protein
MRHVVLACLVLVPLSAAASSTGSFSVEYTGTSHGFTVLKLAGSLDLTPTGYSARVTFHTAGMAAWMLRSDNDSQVTGIFDGDKTVPRLFQGSGHLRNTDRLTRISYSDGNPVIEALSPPVEQERTPVPVQQTTHTIDTLSAVVMLIRSVGEHGTCDGSVTTFDGRRLSSQAAHTVGHEILPRSNRSIFAGDAVRCDFVGQQLAGFVRNEDEDSLKKPRYGSAWLASIVPDAPPVPVRVVFDNKILGQVTLYLTSVSAK